MLRNTLRSAFVAAVVSGSLGAAATAQMACTPAIANEALTPAVPGVVLTIASYDDGSGGGPVFFAGGTIPSMGNIALLTPSGWQGAGAGVAGSVSALEVIDDGSGPGGRPALYAGGAFAGGLARWDGTTWQPISPAPGAGVTAMVRYDDGSGAGPALYVLLLQGALKKFSGTAWQTVAMIDSSAPGGSVDRVLALDDDAAGPDRRAIFVASVFDGYLGQSPVNEFNPSSGVVKYDGQSLTGLPGRPYGVWIKAAAAFDDGLGAGPGLYISGHYLTNFVPTGVARWNPAAQTWTGLGATTDGDAAYALDSFADGVGPRPRLYAVGGYATLGETPEARIAAWDGQTWTPIYFPLLTDVTSMNYHLASRTGVLGTARIPALLCVRGGNATSTNLFAVVGCPRCPADTNLDGQVAIDDLFGYLDAWFAGQPSADIGGNGLTVQDIFEYLAAWFDGCN